MVAGTMIAVWMGELITEQGVGNGVSIIIFGGIVAQMPSQVAGFVSRGDWVNLVLFSSDHSCDHCGYCLCAGRPAPYSGAVRKTGTWHQGLRWTSAHIPLKVNSAGMIPLIFAQSIMIFPSAVAASFQFSENQFVAGVANGIVTWFSPNPQSWPYWIMYFIMVVGFTYFYTDVIFKQQNLSENLQRQGGFIPGKRPGRQTKVYLETVLTTNYTGGRTDVGLGCYSAVDHQPDTGCKSEWCSNPVFVNHQYWFAHCGWGCA
jgi:preprotein translocase subunit SecY